jgi:rod shape-determining protein MreB
MLGRTPGNIIVVKPLKNGVIADFKVTEKMLNYFIQKANQRKTMVHPRIVISVPSEITQVEQRAVMESAYRAKAAEVHLVEQAMMAAIGTGLPVTEPGGQHGGGYRRWHHRRRRHLAPRHRLFALAAHRRQSHG